MEAVIDVIFCK